LLRPVRDEWAQLGVDAGVTYSAASSNPSLRIDCDAAHAAGRLTWWADGSMFSEAVRIADEATLMSETGTATTDIEVVLYLRKLGSVVGGEIAS
jgi:hypothetical protein